MFACAGGASSLAGQLLRQVLRGVRADLRGDRHRGGCASAWHTCGQLPRRAAFTDEIGTPNPN